jgi:CRISPR type III-A-associated RAMP protein Csm5
MKWILTCLTPVHIGTGRELHPMEYAIRNGTYYVLRLDPALEYLEGKVTGVVEKYMEHATQALEELARSRGQGQKLRYYAEDVGILQFCEKELKRRDLAEQLLRQPDVVAYRCDGVTWRPQGKHRQVREQMKFNGLPYIPGTSIKGAIRTSLAYALLLDLSDQELDNLLGSFPDDRSSVRARIQDLKQKYETALGHLKQGNDQQAGKELADLAKQRSGLEKRIGEPLDHFFFRCGAENRGEVKYDEPHMDLLRVLRISDCHLRSGGMTVGEMFARAARRSAQSEIPIPAEMIDREARLEFEMSLDVRLLQEMARNASKSEREWIGFPEKFRRLFACEPQELLRLQKPDELARWEKEKLDLLLRRVHRHSVDILKRDERWAKKAANDVGQGLLQALNELRARAEKAGDGCLLRVGFASGWHATTVAMALEERGKTDLLSDLLYVFLMDLPQNLRRTLTRQGLSNKQNHGTILRLLRRTPDASAFPTSRRLLREADGQVTPIGWVWLEEASSAAVGTERERRVEERSQPAESRTSEEITPEDLERLQRRFRGEE